MLVATFKSECKEKIESKTYNFGPQEFEAGKIDSYNIVCTKGSRLTNNCLCTLYPFQLLDWPQSISRDPWHFQFVHLHVYVSLITYQTHIYTQYVLVVHESWWIANGSYQVVTLGTYVPEAWGQYVLCINFGYVSVFHHTNSSIHKYRPFSQLPHSKLQSSLLLCFFRFHQFDPLATNAGYCQRSAIDMTCMTLCDGMLTI